MVIRYFLKLREQIRKEKITAMASGQKPIRATAQSSYDSIATSIPIGITFISN